MLTWSEHDIASMTPAQRLAALRLVAGRPDVLPPIWAPLPGPQTMAYNSKADVIGFGGAAGGGKTDLAIGKALMQHRRAMVFRLNGTEHTAFNDRLTEIVGSDDAFNTRLQLWRAIGPRGLQLELGSIPNLGDEKKYRGRPHDLKVFDEAAEIPEFQVRFLLAWLRSTDPNQPCQALLTFNPPANAQGRWIIQYFAPWIDKDYKGQRAMPGELRWFANIPDPNLPTGFRDTEVADGRHFIMRNGERVYDFNPADYPGALATQIIRPQSRTFIPSRVTDNPYYSGGAYMTQLQMLPEPLRSQMLNGDFAAGIKDDPWQVIPTAWVDEAMARWVKLGRKPPMDSIGVDVARGGADNTILARRHDNWYDEPIVYAGKDTPDGPTCAAYVIGATRDNAVQHIDGIGVGSSVYDFLAVHGKQQAVSVIVSEASGATDESGRLAMYNKRSELWWKFREDLDPKNNKGICLPPNDELRKDLTAPRWEVVGNKVKVESREKIVERIGRSPDYGSAYVLARLDTPKINALRGIRDGAAISHDPYQQFHVTQPVNHDPYA